MPSSFQDWLEKWQNRSEKIPCYNPRNMQTFAFLCKASSSHLAFQNPQRASHISYPTQNPKAREWRRKSWRSWPTDTDVKEAIVRMHNTSLVGITAHFKASLCLLQAGYATPLCTSRISQRIRSMRSSSEALKTEHSVGFFFEVPVSFRG